MGDVSASAETARLRPRKMADPFFGGDKSPEVDVESARRPQGQSEDSGLQ